MVWKLPTREIGGQPLDDGLLLPPEHLARNTGEFKRRIVLRNQIHLSLSLSLSLSDFDAIEDISGGMGKLKLPPTYPTSTEYGAYLHKLPRLNPTGQKRMHQPVSNDVSKGGGKHNDFSIFQLIVYNYIEASFLIHNVFLCMSAHVYR